jgi:hypothetical protein
MTETTFKLKPLQCVTSAPTEYDYRWAKTIDPDFGVDKNGRKLRLVEGEDQWHFNQQMMRYGSGMHIVIADQKRLDDEITGSWITLTKKKTKTVEQRVHSVLETVRDAYNKTMDSDQNFAEISLRESTRHPRRRRLTCLRSGSIGKVSVDPNCPKPTTTDTWMSPFQKKGNP